MSLARRYGGAEALALHEIDFLLAVSRSSAEIEHLRAAGVHYNAFYAFAADRMPVSAFRALWHAHGPFLRAEAARRGIPVSDPDTFGPVDGGRSFWVWHRFEQRSRC
jgi:hypothetical protein